MYDVEMSRGTSGDVTVVAASEVASVDTVMGGASGGSMSEEVTKTRGVVDSARSRSPRPVAAAEARLAREEVTEVAADVRLKSSRCKGSIPAGV